MWGGGRGKECSLSSGTSSQRQVVGGIMEAEGLSWDSLAYTV